MNLESKEALTNDYLFMSNNSLIVSKSYYLVFHSPVKFSVNIYECLRPLIPFLNVC